MHCGLWRVIKRLNVASEEEAMHKVFRLGKMVR